MLKKFIQTALLLVVLCTTATTYAQVSQAPDGIQFQALATDANGHPAAGRVIYVKDAIVGKTATGTIVYSETFKVTASSAGIFTIVLGKGTYASGVTSIANIDWANGPFFLNLKIAVEPTVPTASWNVNNEYVDLGTSQFWSVPYALYAGNVKGADTKLNISDTAAMLKPYFTSINLKANIESPTFTGTVSGITKAMVGLGNVDNTADVNKPISTATQAALDLKANATDVTTALALKANTTDVTTALALKANATDVTTALALKANASDVNTALDLKVDKVSGKALSTNDYTTAEKTKLAAITGTNTGDQDLSALAVAANVNTALDLKVDKVTGKALSTNDYTTAEKTKLAAITGTNTGDQDLSALATNTALALKASAADVTTALDLKVDKVTGKALSTNDYTTAEKTKLAAITGTNTGDQDLSSLATSTALALKANTADVNASLSNKENESNKSVNVTTDAASDTKYPSVKAVKTYVDAQLVGSAIADASASVKGKIQLAGDLGGTADAPTVPGLALKANAADVSSLTTTVNSNTASITANTNDIALKAPIASPTFTGTVSGITKSMVGLGSVDNTTDAAKPISTATQAALDLKANSADLTSLTTTVNANTASITANTSNILLKANTTDVNTALALKANAADLTSLTTTVISNTASITANTSNIALKAPIASPTFTGTVSGITKSMVGLGAVDNTTDAAKPISTATQTALDLKANSADLTTLTTTVNTNTASITANTSDIALKANTTDVNTALALKAPLASPALSGVPTAPTASASTSNYQIATTAFVASAVNTLSGNSVPYTGAIKSVDLGNYDLKVYGLTIGKGGGAATLNTAIGGYSLKSNSTGNSNTAIGYLSLYNNLSGAYNTASGVGALQRNTTGSNNTANGVNSLTTNSTGENNTSIGSFSLERNSTGSNNIAIGYYSLNNNTTAGSNTAIGNQSLFTNSTGEQNTANGYKSLRLNTGSYNTANGTYSLEVNETGSYNTAIGQSSGSFIANGQIPNTTSDYSVYLGSNTKASADDAQNEVVIGYNAIGGGSNTVTLGNTSVTKVITSGALTVGMGSSSISGGLIVGAASSSVTSAVLEVSSTTQGFLPPRMSGRQRDAISSKVAGLVVWCSNCGSNGELQVYNGTTWTNIIGGTASSPPLEVGMAYQGGIIAYILQSGDPGYDANVQHGLIAATSDQSSGIIWGPYSTTGATGATGTAIGTGSTNTDAIILSQGNSYSYAAKLCADYSVTLNSVVYDDWYLPSKDELGLVFNAKSSIGGFSANGDYWSSSEKSSTYAFFQEFYYSGFKAYTGKDQRYRVRAIRSF